MGASARVSPYERALDAGIVAVLFGAACAVVRARGFDHVSDDDFARVTIAQTFAAAPRLDPSGTSWLPFPFWALGGAMAVVGRSLDAARTLSVTFAALAAPLPYFAMRATGASRRAALAGVTLALASPWALWLGASTVPEPFTASLTAAGAIVAANRSAPPRARALGALALFAACLSRYEPWPVAATVAAALVVEAVRERRGATLGLAAAVVAAPAAWMLWNAQAHGSALHFLDRVARYRRAIGQGTDGDLVGALTFYPRLWWTTRPELVVALGIVLGSLGRATLRARWLVPLACVASQVVFLAYGAAKDGAPTHHAERALLAAFTLVACSAADGLDVARWRATGRARGLGAGAAILVAGLAIAGLRRLADPPGQTAWEDRSAQIARGLALRGEEALTVTPCAYEHFALVAAYGAPERVTLLARTGREPTSACPDVTPSPR